MVTKEEKQHISAMAHTCIRYGYYEKAMALLRALLKLFPLDACLHRALIFSLCKTGRYRLAETHWDLFFKQAEDLTPADLVLRGMTLKGNGQDLASRQVMKQYLMMLNSEAHDA